MKILLIDAHLFYEYLVRQSIGQATKGRNVKIKRLDINQGINVKQKVEKERTKIKEKKKSQNISTTCKYFYIYVFCR